MPGKFWNRRRRLILRYTSLSLAALSVVTILLIVLRGRTRRYSPGEKVAGITHQLARGLPAGYPVVRFTNVAREAGIDFVHFPGTRSTQLPEDMGSGAAWGDYDGDGDPDLFVCNIAAPLTATPAEVAASTASNRLYRNNGDGTFTDVTAHAGLGYKGLGMGAAWADYDNDGDLDLVVTTYRRILLYRNRGDGTFQEVSAAAGLARHKRFWTGASWADYDGDGDLDLYVCAYVNYKYDADYAGKTSPQFATEVPFTLNPSSYPPEPNALFRNNGDGTFTDVAKAAGVADPTGRSLNASWCDFDLDGRPDIYVANDVSDNAMFRNAGRGRFEDVSHQALVSDYRGAMGLAVGDYDSDGDFDIFITHWIAQENALFWNMLRNGPGITGPPELRFADIADMLGLGQKALNVIGWGTSFFDFDNDGQLDLFVSNGSTFQRENDPTRLVPMKNFLLWQKSPEDGFFDLAPVSGPVFQQPHVGRGAAFADYDGDGDMDIFVVNSGEAPLLLRNDGGTGNHWIEVRLQTPNDGHSGLGAIVEVATDQRTQRRYLGCQPSYLSQNAMEAHFGLGRATLVNRVSVHFSDGVTRQRRNVAVDQRLIIKE